LRPDTGPQQQQQRQPALRIERCLGQVGPPKVAGPHPDQHPSATTTAAARLPATRQHACTLLPRGLSPCVLSAQLADGDTCGGWLLRVLASWMTALSLSLSHSHSLSRACGQAARAALWFKSMCHGCDVCHHVKAQHYWGHARGSLAEASGEHLLPGAGDGHKVRHVLDLSVSVTYMCLCGACVCVWGPRLC